MTAISKQEFTDYVRQFRHKELFNYLGWDNDQTAIPPQKAGEEIVAPKIIADKNGFKIITAEFVQIPPYAVRSQVAVALKKLFAENIVIFTDRDKREQVWRYGKVEIKYNIAQDTERLYQRASGLIFNIDEQDNITIVDVTARVKTNFAANAERVTKKFYEAFRKEHKALLELISGITNTLDREWYASIMLNRLMFCYFMQRRGFLDNNRDYLRDKLKESKQKLGKGKFYSFYRGFLMVLFQKGFGTYEHPAEVVKMIGKIPYLNGGLFDLHEVENRNPDIDISDDAFERIFELFDRYEWHLDTRECATGNEINPDVLGYIFEKYINDRAAMGAYYTQEDITGYISRSTILPYLLDSVKKAFPKPFEKDGAVWAFLRESADAYIFDSVKKGTDLPLPDHIAVGVDTTRPNLIERRKAWNTPAPAEYALPTEIWREVVDRRNRYFSVKGKIENGEIAEVADFITYNLDIVNFVGDLIDTIEDPKFIREFYSNLEKITILDPTCGSGAFLFAAMNILEPLYDSCLSRMDDYINHDYKGILDKNVRRFFEDKLALMQNEIHPNKRYFIYKSIILGNLYGVDIMREAVETAKLRLFLKLVSTAQPQLYAENYGIEPLPDIDFNVKCGNTLIGFANKGEIDAVRTLFNDIERANAYEKMMTFANATARYKELQLGGGDYSSGDFKTAKAELNRRQNELRAALDAALKSDKYEGVSDADWKTKYLPFHWVAEFYSIIVENGGFDVVIGNPPYVGTNKIDYALNGYLYGGRDLYAHTIERSFGLVKDKALFAMIVPLSLVSTDTYNSIYKQLKKRGCYFANFSADTNPGVLFDGVKHNLTVFVTSTTGKVYTTRFYRFYNAERGDLFPKLVYFENAERRKVGSAIEANIYNKVTKTGKLITQFFCAGTQYCIYVKNTTSAQYKPTFDELPYLSVGGLMSASSTLTKISFDDDKIRLFALALLNSNLFNLWWCSLGDARHITNGEYGLLHVDAENKSIYKIGLLAQDLMSDYRSNAKRVVYQKRNGETIYDQFEPRKSKHIIDKIDTVLAEHYGFTEEELDYIINYDIKYRMGIGGDTNYDE
jgi:hypothetical protein